MNNVTGWNDLIEGNIIKGVFNMFDAVVGGWLITILFFVFQSILFIKTRNVTLCWITGIFFAAVYGFSTYMKATGIQLMFILLALELAGILVLWFIK